MRVSANSVSLVLMDYVGKLVGFCLAEEYVDCIVMQCMRVLASPSTLAYTILDC